MLLDALLPSTRLRDVPAIARAAEEFGFAGLWSSETQHDPLLPLALAAEHSQRLTLGTALTVAYARTPGALAYPAWDLAQASGGRFIFGLGTQVRAHIERRFGGEWPESPAGRMREIVAALRALWASWQTGEKLNFRGRHFKLTLMSPFFNPGPIDTPDIPIYLAGVNPAMCRVAGETAQGFLVHPYHTVKYLDEVVRPAIAEGEQLSGRPAGSVALFVTAFVVPEPSMAGAVRAQIAFYASTPAYRPVMERHGWGEMADELSQRARRGAWSEMGDLISDAMLEAFAVVAPWQELSVELERRYRGRAARLAVYLPFRPGERDEFWRDLAAGLASIS
ncbi:MAG: TIGR03617 family F420-dependent LLM class oxidoreductase [Anaerolineales bacterium]